jgi:hypothetical protein
LPIISNRTVGIVAAALTAAVIIKLDGISQIRICDCDLLQPAAKASEIDSPIPASCTGNPRGFIFAFHHGSIYNAIIRMNTHQSAKRGNWIETYVTPD